MTPQRVLAVDPGREKCGLAVLDRNSGVLWRRIVATEHLLEAVLQLFETQECPVVAVGNRTHSTEVRKLLQPLLDQGRVQEMTSVDEHGSTEAARLRYWQVMPPKGWRRFVPRGLLVPPCAIDDFAAIIIAERYFKKI